MSDNQNSQKSLCSFCRSTAKSLYEDYDKDLIKCDCPICGKYTIRLSTGYIHYSFPDEKDKTAAYLFYANKLAQLKKKPHFDQVFYSRDEQNYEFETVSDDKFLVISPKEVNNWYPKTISEKTDMALSLISDFSPLYGGLVPFDYDALISCFFIKRYKDDKLLTESAIKHQFDFFTTYLYTNGYISEAKTDTFFLTAKGWQRVDELQKHQTNNKEVFVAMSFAENAKPIREAIKAGIVDAGFSPVFMDEKIHNQQIVPEMLRLIRECRLLIMDISDPNCGAYYEAGYASGLGKEVIITCSKYRKDKKYETEEEKKYERYLKPHFDIAQKQTLVWDDYNDLTKKLTEWIKELMTR